MALLHPEKKINTLKLRRGSNSSLPGSKMLARRSLMRLLRVRNLAVITLLIVFIYFIRNMFHTLDMESLKKQQHPLGQKKEIDSTSRSKFFKPKSKIKIDWHDYEQIAIDKKRSGIGEQGAPAFLDPKEKSLEDSLYAVNGFNGALSDKIAIDRSLPDIRHPKCAKRLYYQDLPTVSVVVPFHNEHWSTLLRTAHSVILRSPTKLIKEVFLVDDASTKSFLKKKLDDYLAKNLPKARVIRLANRSGLITARLKGAVQATGDVIIFLDSHTEANVNWLPPLLEPIAENPRTVVCPYIDVIAYDTFEYRAQDEGARGGFDWELFYKRLPLLPQDEENMPEPFASPVMAGGLFAIAREYFWELGGYDPGLDIWGGEQYELSFKIWQCGGKMVDAPCSRVGHIYRKFAPFPNPNHGDFVAKNYRRVAEVWMDEYAQYLYQRRPHYLTVDPGDLAEQRALRQRLKCKPFRWFITQIAFDLTAKYPPVEPPPFAKGRVVSVHSRDLCVDMQNGGQQDSLGITDCSMGREIQFIFTWHKDIRSSTRSMCWDLADSSPGSPVQLYGCHLGGGNQLWRYHPDKKIIKHSSGNCLDFDPVKKTVFGNTCNPDSQTQQWRIDSVNKDRMKRWDDIVDRVTGPIEEDY